VKKNRTQEPPRQEIIVQKSLEDVMHDSMMPYSEHVILERALPRAEDGLKPVQRRILYTMHELGVTPDKPHRKCARIVGDCLGKYHPHGDSSVYDALARMAQPYSLRGLLVDGHGNFGSIDGDSPAAMRYTEARMAPLAIEKLRDNEKDTVPFRLNFDDTQKEPDLLPAHFPNLLVNGASGIAVGLATNIPPHNLKETILAAVAQMENPKITLDELMQHIPAPDFPTGGILVRSPELKTAYETGRGKLKLRSRVHVEDGSAGRKLLVITEVPYQTPKAYMLEKILRLSEEKKSSVLSGIYDIRDESDRSGLRAVIELKKDADPQKVLAYLYKYSDLQVTFGVNMVAISGGKPVQLGLKDALDCFIRHQKDVVTRRTRYELDQAQARAHILEGLIVAVDNLDEVIRLIRASKNPKEAREALMKNFPLDEIQAQAILDMRLQRLTGLEILTLRKEFEELQKLIKKLQGILKSEKKLIELIKGEMLEIAEKFGDARRTALVEDDESDAPAPEAPAEAEDTVILRTRGEFYRRVAPRLAEKGLPEDVTESFRLKENEKLLFFTDRGSCFQLMASQIPECRLRDRGMPPGALLAGLEEGENVIAIRIPPADWKGEYVFVTANGTVKKCAVDEMNVRKGKYAALTLKGDDRLMAMPEGEGDTLLLITKQGMAIRFSISEIPVQGRTAAGVKGITLAAGDNLMTALRTGDEGEVVLATDMGYMKRCLMVDFEPQARGGKGAKCITFQKNGATGACLAGAVVVREPVDLLIVQKGGAVTRLPSEGIRIDSRAAKGMSYVLVVMDDTVCGMEVAQPSEEK